MAVGPLNAHEAIICGYLTVTLVDGEGNIKAVRQTANIVNTYAKKILYSCAHAAGGGVSAAYIWVASGMSATPTLSMANAFSGSPGGNASINYTNNPISAQASGISWMNDTQWSVNTTMSWLGYGGFSSVDAAALCFGANATYSASLADRPLTSWWAQACFTDLAINSVDKLSFNWAFSLSTTTSTAV
jgi:hypothetical protein